MDMALRISEADVDVLARTIYGEARGEPWQGKVAVAHVVLNRVTRGGWWGDTIAEVCLKAWQFSAWNAEDVNRDRLRRVSPEDEVFKECLAAAAAALGGITQDPTRGATHYHAVGLKPSWTRAMRPTIKIGRHFFYHEPSRGA